MLKKRKPIPLSKLAQYRHIKLLTKLEKQALLAYRYVMKQLFKEIIGGLKQEKLAKSDDKLPPGWTGNVPKIKLDLSGHVTKVIEKYMKALQWMLIGDYAGKDARKIAKDIGLVGKVVPGILEGAYFDSLDAHRRHHFDLFGEHAPEISKDLMRGSIDEIVDRARRLFQQTLEQIKVNIIETLDQSVKEINMGNFNTVLEEAHDLLPRDGAEAAIDQAIDGTTTQLSSHKLIRDLNKMSKTFESKWDLNVRKQTTTSSAVGTHQAMYELYGDKTDRLDIAVIEMEDERVCTFCKHISKHHDGSFKLYKLEDFKPSGYNHSRKRSEWQLSISPMHFNCRCQMVYVPQGFEISKDGTIKPKG